MTTLSPAPRSNEPAAGSEEAPCDERELLQAAIDGDSRAFEQVVHVHHARVFNFLRHMTRHQADAEDLTQQTFLKAFQHLGRFDGRRPVIHWLLTIARHNALNHFRSTNKWTFAPAELACAAPSPARQVEVEDRVDELWARARRVLSQREFEVLWLRFSEELSTQETARVMGLTQIHVKVLVHRARQHLLKGEKNA